VYRGYQRLIIKYYARGLMRRFKFGVGVTKSERVGGGRGVDEWALWWWFFGLVGVA